MQTPRPTPGSRRPAASPGAALSLALALASAAALILAGTGAARAQPVTPERLRSQQHGRVNPQRPQDTAPPPPAPRREREQDPSEAAVIGLLDLHRRKAPDLPTGRGVILGHVEGKPGQYTPNLRDDRYTRINFVKRSGASEPFGHAQGVARKLYGRGGLAPGITEVHNFASADWLGEGLLNAGSSQPPKLDDRPRLYTHSWISDLTGKAGADVLRRVDYLIDTADVLMCVGVNNGRGSSVPPLLGSAYNVIAVGAVNGNSSGGYTRFEGEGRSKPDVVAPGGLTSFATPVAAAVVARLIEAADRMAPPPVDQDEAADNEPNGRRGDTAPARHGADHPAARAELIKAVLMAGAVKPAAWAPADGKPLDEHFGAGVVNIDHALTILRAGQTPPGQVRQRHGWDVRAAHADATYRYHLDVRDALGPVSIMLTWHRRIDGRTIIAMPRGASQPIRAWINAPRLADFDLRLIEVRDDGSERVMLHSASRIDNVEHLYLPVMLPGRYRLDVVRQPDDHDDPTWDYALAWRIEDEAGVDARTLMPEALRSGEEPAAASQDPARPEQQP